MAPKIFCELLHNFFFLPLPQSFSFNFCNKLYLAFITLQQSSLVLSPSLIFRCKGTRANQFEAAIESRDARRWKNPFHYLFLLFSGFLHNFINWLFVFRRPSAAQTKEWDVRIDFSWFSVATAPFPTVTTAKLFFDDSLGLFLVASTLTSHQR